MRKRVRKGNIAAHDVQVRNEPGLSFGVMVTLASQPDPNKGYWLYRCCSSLGSFDCIGWEVEEIVPMPEVDESGWRNVARAKIGLHKDIGDAWLHLVSLIRSRFSKRRKLLFALEKTPGEFHPITL